MRLLLLLVALSLAACGQIEVNDAKVTNPKDRSLKGLQFKILDTRTRNAINAANPDALIAIFDESGVILYGAPGKDFRIEPREQPGREASKVDAKEPVNDVVIRTFVNSPLCQEIYLGGDRIWYPSGCPH